MTRYMGELCSKLLDDDCRLGISLSYVLSGWLAFDDSANHCKTKYFQCCHLFVLELML